MNTETMQRILQKIKDYDRIIITRHFRPDGDAVGSTKGLWKILQLSFPEKEILLINEDQSEYLKFLGGEVYSRKADRKVVSRDKTFRAELVAYAVVACVQFFMQFSVGAILYAPIAYLIFHIYNRRLWLNLHETWADERIRLNPDA